MPTGRREGETAFKNPRNAAAGSLRTLDSGAVGKRKLNLVVYALASAPQKKTHSGTLDWLGELGFPVSPERRKCKTLAEVAEFYKHWDTARDDLDYMIDGTVIKVDDLGFTTRSG